MQIPQELIDKGTRAAHHGITPGAVARDVIMSVYEDIREEAYMNGWYDGHKEGRVDGVKEGKYQLLDTLVQNIPNVWNRKKIREWLQGY